MNVSYETFKGVFDQSSELKNAIQQFNDHEITFITPGTAVDSEYEEPSGDQPPEEKVDQMAKRASNKRI
ncbi:MAG: hypothetical protein H8D23_36790 [Candidatus Brocadiales bacterium]|nr:hypothetical protein [Candidatus Brocadiales bacterium]